MHILSPETDNCPSWISGRERMTVEIISLSISMKECCRPWRASNPRPHGLQSDAHPTEPLRPAKKNNMIWGYPWNATVTEHSLLKEPNKVRMTQNNTTEQQKQWTKQRETATEIPPWNSQLTTQLSGGLDLGFTSTQPHLYLFKLFQIIAKLFRKHKLNKDKGKTKWAVVEGHK